MQVRRRKEKTSPPWTKLPHSVTANILHRLGPVEILETAQKVCTTWRNVCKDPAMWRVINMRNLPDMPYDLGKMCRHAVDRSQGNLADINLEYFADDELLDYIAKSSGKLRYLRLARCYSLSDEGFIKFIKGLPLLEVFHIILTPIEGQTIETVGRFCPLLSSFAFNENASDSYDDNPNEYAFAIARSMPELRHLQLLGNGLTNEGLEAILNGCPHLESLDLCRCQHVKLIGDLWKRLSAQIKCLRINKQVRRRKVKTFPPWTELPHDITVNILHRLGAIEILETAQKVCTTWRSVCTDPEMWHVIDMSNFGDLHNMPYDFGEMCRHAVDRSQGHLVDIHLESFADDELLNYIAESSPKLRCLRLERCYSLTDECLIKFIEGLPLFEELHIVLTLFTDETIETVGRSCPLLRSFALNGKIARYDDDTYAFTIARSMPGLRHLQLWGNRLTNDGLEAILNGCPHLESLDLRRCHHVNLNGDLGKRLSAQIKCLRYPYDLWDLQHYDVKRSLYSKKKCCCRSCKKSLGIK